MSAYEHALHDESARGLLDDATVEKAAYIIDSAGLPELLEEWRLADKKGKGGRPAHIPMRTVLIGWLLLAMELQPMHVRQLSILLHTRLTQKAADQLGIEHSPLAEVRALEERVRAATTRIFDLVDAEPVSNRHRRQTMAERKRDLEWREKNADTIEVRRQRRDILQNALLEATYQLLPEHYRPDRVSVTVDATRFKLHARGVGKKRLEVMSDDGLVSVEPDAGYYKRDSKGNIPDPNSKLRPRISEYALEAEFAVLSSNDPSRPHAVPNIVMAYGVHIPGQQPVKAARRMVDSLWSRGHQIDHFAGDRAYLPAGDPDVLQNPLRLSGAKLLMDYPIDQLGQQATKHGAILVEGTWYSPDMPKRLIDATKVYREALRADEKNPNLTAGDRRERAIALERTWRGHLKQRSQYRLREKEKPDDKGRVPMVCPAAGPNPLVTCPLKDLIKDTRVSAPTVMPVLPTSAMKSPGAVCTNKTSTTFNVTDGGSYGQYYEFGSEEWESHYHHGRNNVESFNAYVKDAATFDLASPGRRRMRGFTAQSILVVITVAAANIRKVREFLAERAVEELDAAEGVIAPAAGTRRHRKGPASQNLVYRARKGQRMNRVQSRNPVRT